MEFSSYEIVSRARHLKYLFLIESNYDGSKMIALMRHNMRLWGGRLNPIVPVHNGEVTKDWRTLITNYDPDYVCHTANVPEQFAIKLCSELRLNPVELINIDSGLDKIEGVPSQYLVPTIKQVYNEGLFFLQSSAIRDLNSPLRDYYLLNYLIDCPFPKDISGKYEVLDVPLEKVGELNKMFAEKRIYNSTLFSSANCYTTILRSVKHIPNYFELVIIRDYSSKDDLIYYWNRMLYSSWTDVISALLITTEQLDLLLSDPYFKAVLYNLPTNDSRIDLVSFSLGDDELLGVLGKLKRFTNHNRFTIRSPFSFPFEIMDSRLPSNDYRENPIVQIIYNKNHLIFPPLLTFERLIKGWSHRWCMDIQITENESGKETNVKKFPHNTEPTSIAGKQSRISKNRQLVVLDGSSTWQLNIPSFFNNIQQIITHPRVINQQTRFVYDTCSYNDASNRLQQFFTLFQNDFNFIEEFIYDKFWSDLFYELTNNVKVEGDVITFQSLFDNCANLFDKAGGLKPASEDFRNEVNLAIGLKKTLQRLIDSNIFFPGFVIKCRSCSSKIWYSLSEINESVICKGCRQKNTFRAELPISYKLNHLIKNNIGMRSTEGVFSPDGNLTVIKTLLYLHHNLHSNFEYLPQMDIYKDYKEQKPVTDLDIICLVNGQLYIGECKHSSSAFSAESSKSLNNLLRISESVDPDFIILSCTDDAHDRLDKSVQYLKHHLRNSNSRPEIIPYKTREPDYFELTGYKYFDP